MSLAERPSPVAVRRAARREQILAAAEAIVAADGVEGLTMRRLADEVGMQAPSLYKHLRDKEEVLVALQESALQSMGEALAGAEPDLGSLAAAYRSWALDHPALYEVGTGLALRRNALTPGLESWAAEPLVAVVGGDEHRARAVWAAAHGLVDLELHDRFPPDADLDAAWAAMVDAFK
ncbi:MAG TPA: WHG domain-containing protein [Microthrixaceae bacterium]|nr:WHG domain-containing protein [Microthrixaceae bacterium]